MSNLKIGRRRTWADGSPFISLLHATWRREGGPLEVRNFWLESAEDPSSVEYIFALDSDDDHSLAETEGLNRVVGEHLQHSSAVRNWNSAAKISTGKLLFVVADDYFPQEAWDKKIIEASSGFNPLVAPFVLKVSDSRKYVSTWVQHPIVSRAFYERFGLFSDKYSHLYCDNDFSIRASRRVPILDCRHIVFFHKHPGEGYEFTSASQARGRSEALKGRKQFELDHGFFSRVLGSGITPRWLIPVVSRAPFVAPLLQTVCAIPQMPRNLKREWRRLWKSPALRPYRRTIRRIRVALHR